MKIPSGWLCPKCSRVYAPMNPSCGPCNAPIDASIGEMRWAIRFDFPGESEAIFAGMYNGSLGWTHGLDSAMVYESPEVAQKTLEYAYGDEARRHGRVIGVRPRPLNFVSSNGDRHE
jgi:hypothetical protein